MLTVEDILKATRGTLLQGEKTQKLKGVSIDTRTLSEGKLFVAIKGERFDGHRFIATAIRKGAKAIVCSKEVSAPKGICIIRVKDTTKALGQIARFHRRRFSVPVVVITGSTGKTTTKDMVSAVLATRLRVLKNVKTENNHIGVPLTLLKLTPKHQIVVLEIGTNQVGDIDWLAQITEPDVAIFTNVGESHLQGLKSVSGVYREKTSLIKRMKSSGCVIFNGDDRFLRRLKSRELRQRKVSYGIDLAASYRATDVQSPRNNQIHFKVKGRKYSLSSPARHNIYNAITAICCGSYYKISYNNIMGALKRFRFEQGRFNPKRIGGLWVIDDTYNANPVSMRSAVKTLDSWKVRGKKILICSDMLELGPRTQTFHRAIGQEITHSSIDQVLTIGKNARFITAQIRKKPSSVLSRHFSSRTNLHQYLRSHCQRGDAVLVKGSRAMKMEETVNFLMKRFA